jgi:hypothetical protein
VIAPELCSDDDKFSGVFNVLSFNWADDEVQANRFPAKVEYLGSVNPSGQTAG